MPIALTFPAVYPYLAPSELAKFYGEAEIVQLADRNNDNVADADVLELAIERGAAELDSYLARCYVLPLQPAANVAAIYGHVAMQLAEWTGVIARYRLWADTRPVMDGDNRIPEPRRRYMDVLKVLGGLNPATKGGCMLLASLLTNQAAGIVSSDMPMLASGGNAFRRGNGFASGAGNSRAGISGGGFGQAENPTGDDDNSYGVVTDIDAQQDFNHL